MSDLITASISEINTYRKCPWLHNKRYKERWKEPFKWGALSLGIVWDAGINAWYECIASMQKATKGSYTKPANEIKRRARKCALAGMRRCGILVPDDEWDLLTWMLDGYIERWDIDPQWRIMRIQYRDTLPLAREGEDARFAVTVVIDLIVYSYDYGGLYIVDTKSTQRLPRNARDNNLELDDQFGMYTWALRSRGERVLGAIYSGSKTYRTKKIEPIEDRFRRFAVPRSDTQLHHIAEDALSTLEHAYLSNLPLYSNVGGTNCQYCRYKDAHIGERDGVDPNRILELSGFTQDIARMEDTRATVASVISRA